MKRTTVVMTTALFLCVAVCGLPTGRSVVDATVPSTGGCPQPNHWNLSFAPSLTRRWSTSLPTTGAVLTVAAWASDAQLAEVESAITDSFGAWSGWQA